jgi:type I restriction enzyme S subunit
MGNEWLTQPFFDLYDIPSRNGLTKPKRVRGKGYKFVNMGEIFAHGRMLNIPCDRVPATDKELESSTLEPGDLLFARQSLVLSGAGKCSIFLGDEETVLFESHIIRVRPNPDIISPEYLFYYFNSPIGRAEIWSITEQGAGQAGIRGSDLETVSISFPCLTEQKKIVSILAALDEKIELNRQMNETLEAMAQALFKSWFVDFDPVIDNALAAGNEIPESLQKRAAVRQALVEQLKPLPADIQSLFPDRFVFTDEMGWVPEGWATKSVDELIELTGGGTPKTSVEEYWDGEIPWFSVVDAPSESDVFVINTEKHVSDLGVKNSSTKILRPGTTIISARGTVGKCALVAVPMAMNQSCYAIVGSEGYGDEFTYYLVRYQVAGLQQRSHGSVFSTITRDTFRTINVAAPPQELSTKFSELVLPSFEKIRGNLFSNEQLTGIRDVLLPKLLSGELTISDAEKQVAVAV